MIEELNKKDSGMRAFSNPFDKLRKRGAFNKCRREGGSLYECGKNNL